MKKSKKFLNETSQIVDQAIDGLVAAYGGKVRRLGKANVIVRDPLKPGKVGLLIGGGSGHEPLFAGFVGENLADGAVAGNIFAAPTPDQILLATEAVNTGCGVLYLYGNYAGDNMNFDIAAEMAADNGIAVQTVRIWDDVASAALDQQTDRRGIAGDVFVIKVAGAAAATAATLDEVYRIAAKARDNTRSMGVAAAAGTFPETGEPTFVLADDEIEIGLGLHGEPGVKRGKMQPADAVVDQMLALILGDFPLHGGERVCLLINNLGATTMTELLIINRRVQQVLQEKNIAIHDTLIGAFCTSQEMAGFSISLMKLDDELVTYYDMPAELFALVKGKKV